MTRMRVELTEREKDVLKLREQKVTYNKIGEKYGISGNRVRQICVAARRRIRMTQMLV